MIKPRPYQTNAVKVACAALRKAKRALIDMATGLGKTFTGAFIVQKLKPKRVLFLVHNNYILVNAMEEFREVLEKSVSMALYNGETKAGAKDATIVFATWQTMKNRLRVWKRNHFDLIIVDEAHHTEAETWKPVVSHFDGMKLGLTATPDRTDAIDIRGVFGQEIVKITLEEAIARGWLPRIEYHVITDDSLDNNVLAEITKEIKEGHRRFSMDEINKRLFIRKRDDEIAKIINGYDEKAIVFCTSIEHADRFAKKLKLGDTFHSGRMKKADVLAGVRATGSFKANKKVLDKLKSGEIRRVCAVNAFNEGVNVPSVGLVAFCRVTGSLMIFMQQLGRGLRPGKDKLIVLDFVGNLERVKTVMELMNRIADLHEKITSSKERAREGYSRSKFEVTGTGFEFTFSDTVIDVMKMLESLTFYPTCLEASNATINLGIKSTQEYKVRHKEDPRLPAAPWQYYPNDFPGFRLFLEMDKYSLTEIKQVIAQHGINSNEGYYQLQKKDKRMPHKAISFYGLTHLGSLWDQPQLCWDFDEIRAVVIKYGWKTGSEYRRNRHVDSRLPIAPEKLEGWPGWPAFCDNSRSKYPKTCKQLMKILQKNGINSLYQYSKARKKGLDVPSVPNKYYTDFPGWDKFFSREACYSYVEWIAAVQRLKIKSQKQYCGVYKQDPRLPSNPYRTYQGFDIRWAV